MRCPVYISLVVLLALPRRASAFVARLPLVRSTPTSGDHISRFLDARRKRFLLCNLIGDSDSNQQRALWSTSSGARSSTAGVVKAFKGSSPELDPEALGNTHTSAAGHLGVEDMTLLSAIEAASDVLGGSTQWVVSGSVGAALVTRADAATLVWVVGSLFNAVFSKILKKGINQVRPDGAQLEDPGMPSSHAMSLFFLGTYLVIALQEHGLPDSTLPRWPLDPTETQALLALYATSASLWRVKAGFHTLPQVSVGAVVGALDAVLWYRFCDAYFTSQVETYFGGPDVPVEVAVGICILTFLTFGNAQRRLAKVFGASNDNVKDL